VKREGVYGLLAEFETAEDLHHAATTLLIHGYRHVRIHAPHAISELSGLFAGPISIAKTVAISPVVFAGGAAGAVTAFFVQWYANVIDYPMNIGGKPYDSWPSFIPITFELAILGAAAAALVAMLVLNRLPQFHHPLFNSTRFERATQDRYFICVERRDRKFDREKTAELLLENAVGVEEVRW
jgi:ActD protein